MFCHAWSGGLARDLLRAARTAVEFQRRHPNDPLAIYEIVSHVVLSDLRAAATASFRGLKADDLDTDALWKLLQLVEKQMEVDGQLAAAPHTEVSDLTFHSEALQVLHAKSVLGLHLLRTADVLSRLDNYWDTTSNAMRQLETLLTKVAAAMPRVTGPKPMRDLAVLTATHQFDVRSLDTAVKGTT